MAAPNTSRRVIRRQELVDRVGYSYTHIWRLEKAGLFPGRIQLGPNSVGWVEAEIDDWIDSRMRARGTQHERR